MPTSETLDLARMDAAQFEALYANRIEPVLAAKEVERTAGVKRFQLVLTASIALAVCVAAGIVFIWNEWQIGLFVGAIVGFIGGAIAYHPLGQLQDRTKLSVLDVVADAIGVAYTHAQFAAPAFDRMRSLGLAPSHDRASFEDLFHGERIGCQFDLYEAHLEDERRDKDGDRSYVTVFRGQLIRVAFPKSFQSVTVVRRDAGVFNGLRTIGTNFQRVGLGDSRFEKVFEVYSTDQVEARYLVHPVFMERLLALESGFKGKNIRCAFQGGDLLVAVEGGDQFEIGSMFKPMARPERARALVDDIARVMRLMDSVLTAEQAPLVARGFIPPTPPE